MSFPLSKKTILITGAAGTLGSTYVEKMLDSGAVVIATDIPGERSEKLCKKFSSAAKFNYFELDVGNEEQVEQVFSKIVADGFKPNVVLNNAAITGELLLEGGQSFPLFADNSLDKWERALKVNLTGSFLIARQMDRDIVGRYPATLVNVSSIYALNGPHHQIYEDMPFKSFAAYSASKAGVHGLTIWLAGYWARRRCNVNTLAPGAVFNNHSEVFQQRVGELIMTGRMADPEEIADVMMFLCSDGARYMTGQLVNVDGGFSAW